MSEKAPGRGDRDVSSVSRPALEAEAGLCSACRHARVQTNDRDSRFWRCTRAESDPRYLRYPPLPVKACPGHEAHRD